MEFSEIKVGAHVVIKGCACRLAEVNKSKPGKHGSAKKTVVGIDVITGKKYQEMYNHSSMIGKPDIQRVRYVVTNVEPNEDHYWFSLMDCDSGEMSDDLRFEKDDNSDKVSELFDDAESPVVVLMVVKIEDNTQHKIVEVTKE